MFIIINSCIYPHSVPVLIYYLLILNSIKHFVFMLERSNFLVVGNKFSTYLMLNVRFEGLWLRSYGYEVMQFNG